MLVTQSRRSGDGNPGLIIRTSGVGAARMEEIAVKMVKATNANFMVVSSIWLVSCL